MTLEERLQQLIGQQAFAIASLQCELDKVREQLAKRQPDVEAAIKANGGKAPALEAAPAQ